MRMQVGTTDRSRSRRGSRRPIASWEVFYLERLGDLLRTRRRSAGLTQLELAHRSQLLGLSNIERGVRRTRPSTIARIAKALVSAHPRLNDSEAVAAGLVEAAGPALAPESRYRDRLDRRRRRRARRGLYGPVEEDPHPGEEFRAYLRRLSVQGKLPRRGLCCPVCGFEVNPTVSIVKTGRCHCGR